MWMKDVLEMAESKGLNRNELGQEEAIAGRREEATAGHRLRKQADRLDRDVNIPESSCDQTCPPTKGSRNPRGFAP